MKTKTLVSLVLLIASIALAGCTTLADATQARGKGTKVTYQASFEELWKTMPDTITAIGLRFVSANRDDQSVLALRGFTFLSDGENVAIFIEKNGDARSTVEVVSIKVVKTDLGATNWTKPIFEALDKKFKRA